MSAVQYIIFLLSSFAGMMWIMIWIMSPILSQPAGAYNPQCTKAATALERIIQNKEDDKVDE